uniref:Adipocyte plasma membrane-associated protein n=2 Tax=Schistocephalus solidus TaxID=70667 RepID=A0A0X3PYF6_SCHSO
MVTMKRQGKSVEQKVVEKKGCWAKLSVLVLVFAMCVFFWYADQQNAFDPILVYPPRLPPLEKELAVNDRLTAATREFEGQLVGPECVIVVKGSLYTGIVNGSILKINENGVKTFARFGPAGCSSMETCGRPLGLHYDEPRDRLFVVDACLGLFAIDMQTAKVTKIFPLNTAGVDPVKVTFFNALDMLPDGRIVMTESSQKFSLPNLIGDLLEGRPSGRVFLVDPSTGEWSVLAKDLYFANGIQLHSDQQSVLVAETGMARVLRIPLTNGTKHEVFADSLPGLPDNVNRSPRGGYWVSMAIARSQGSPSLIDVLANWPTVRRFLYMIFPSKFLQYVGSLKKHAMIVRVDENGKILESLHDTSGHMYNVADVCEKDGVLWLGSYRANFIGRLKI